MTRTCAVDHCDSPVESRGWCRSHYYRWRRHGDPLAGRYRTPQTTTGTGRPCDVHDCPRPHYALGYCRTHHARLQRYGTTECPSRTVDQVAVSRAIDGNPPAVLTTGEREEIVRRLHRQDLNDVQIAEHLDITVHGVLRIRQRLGLPAVVTPTWTRAAA